MLQKRSVFIFGKYAIARDAPIQKSDQPTVKRRPRRDQVSSRAVDLKKDFCSPRPHQKDRQRIAKDRFFIESGIQMNKIVVVFLQMISKSNCRPDDPDKT